MTRVIFKIFKLRIADILDKIYKSPFNLNCYSIIYKNLKCKILCPMIKRGLREPNKKLNKILTLFHKQNPKNRTKSQRLQKINP